MCVCVCVCLYVCVCVCVYFVNVCVCLRFLVSLFIHPGEMRRKFYYTRSQDTPKWLRTMFDKCMEELSSDFPAGCKNKLEIESSTKIGTCQNPSKLTVVCTTYPCQSTCRSVLSSVHVKPGHFLNSSCSFSQNLQCVLCSWYVPVALAVPSCSLCCSAGS